MATPGTAPTYLFAETALPSQKKWRSLITRTFLNSIGKTTKTTFDVVAISNYMRPPKNKFDFITGDTIKVSAQWASPYNQVCAVSSQRIRSLNGNVLHGWNQDNYDKEVIHFLHPNNAATRWIGKVKRTGQIGDFPCTVVRLKSDMIREKKEKKEKREEDRKLKEGQYSENKEDRKNKSKKSKTTQIPIPTSIPTEPTQSTPRPKSKSKSVLRKEQKFMQLRKTSLQILYSRFAKTKNLAQDIFSNKIIDLMSATDLAAMIIELNRCHLNNGEIKLSKHLQHTNTDARYLLKTMDLQENTYENKYATIGKIEFINYWLPILLTPTTETIATEGNTQQAQRIHTFAFTLKAACLDIEEPPPATVSTNDEDTRCNIGLFFDRYQNTHQNNTNQNKIYTTSEKAWNLNEEHLYLDQNALQTMILDVYRNEGHENLCQDIKAIQFDINRIITTCNGTGICHITQEEPTLGWISRAKFIEFIYLGTQRKLIERQEFASIASQNNRTEILLTGIEKFVANLVTDKNHRQLNRLKSSVYVQKQVRK